MERVGTQPLTMVIYTEFDETLGGELAKKYDPLAVTPSEVREAYTSFGLPSVLSGDINRLAGPYAESELAGRVRTQAPVAATNVMRRDVQRLQGGIQGLQGGMQELQNRQLASLLLPDIESEKSTIKTPEDLFVDPYADTPRTTASKGGLVEDVTNEIIGIIRR